MMRILAYAVFAYTLVLLYQVACANPNHGVAARVAPSVHRALRRSGKVDIFVKIRGKSTSEHLERLFEAENDLQMAPRDVRITQMVESLETFTAESQRSLEEFLLREAAAAEETPAFSNWKKFWITNQLFIEEASSGLLEKLLMHPSVEEIVEQEVVQVEELTPTIATTGPHLTDFNSSNATIGSPPWGMKRIEVESIWATGNTGQCVVVGLIDTGVRHTHEAIRSNFRGEYGWYDPENKTLEPYDQNGHGTHTTGTLAGANGIGVAPGVTWMACKGCRVGVCPQADLLACAQFMTCPTDTQGNNKDCSKAPRIVSNSWGGRGANSYFQDAAAVWHRAGIIPIFSNGNLGPKCASASSPGDYANVISVGMTAVNGSISRRSSKGPARLTNIIKPDLSAPGVDVLSAWNGHDSHYKLFSGTSMACPHVSGAVALMLSAKPELSYDEVRTILVESVETHSLKPTNASCGNVSDGIFPNNDYGHGLLNLPKAFAVLNA